MFSLLLSVSSRKQQDGCQENNGAKYGMLCDHQAAAIITFSTEERHAAEPVAAGKNCCRVVVEPPPPLAEPACVYMQVLSYSNLDSIRCAIDWMNKVVIDNYCANYCAISMHSGRSQTTHKLYQLIYYDITRDPSSITNHKSIKLN